MAIGINYGAGSVDMRTALELALETISGGVFRLMGARGVGKTVFLQQLYAKSEAGEFMSVLYLNAKFADRTQINPTLCEFVLGILKRNCAKFAANEGMTVRDAQLHLETCDVVFLDNFHACTNIDREMFASEMKKYVKEPGRKVVYAARPNDDLLPFLNQESVWGHELLPFNLTGETVMLKVVGHTKEMDRTKLVPWLQDEFNLGVRSARVMADGVLAGNMIELSAPAKHKGEIVQKLRNWGLIIHEVQP